LRGNDSPIGVSDMTARVWRAPAKVNLTLHILGRREDGWHDLDSIVAFAGVGDILSFAPGQKLALTVGGPTAEKAGPTDDNLVLKAARLLQEQIPALRLGAFHLDKRLPVAAGLGGGSSDAAAALRALALENDLALDDPRLGDAARACGADVFVCLDPRARVMTGVGDLLGPRLKISPLHAVLVNPGAAVPTPAVFARMGLAKGQKTAGGPSPTLSGGGGRDAIIAALHQGRNDMQEAALSIAPIIGDALKALRDSCALLERMSGSGATCFALYKDRAASLEAARAIARAHPTWWVKATVLK
jgi:4-diphosphocytidyl-2-C-methyl-D-erythritol kinase